MKRDRDQTEYEKVFSRLLELRRNSKMTLSEIAEKAQTNESYINRIEKGERTPTLSKLVDMVNAYEVRFNSIFKDYISFDITEKEDKPLECFKDYSFEELVFLLDFTEYILNKLNDKKKTEAE